jgi:hypothetical protein
MVLEDLPIFTPKMAQFCRYIFQHHGASGIYYLQNVIQIPIKHYYSHKKMTIDQYSHKMIGGYDPSPYMNLSHFLLVKLCGYMKIHKEVT